MSAFRYSFSEEALLEADVDVIPGQPRRHRERAEVRRAVDADVRERLFPHGELELVFPRIEARAVPPGAARARRRAGDRRARRCPRGRWRRSLVGLQRSTARYGRTVSLSICCLRADLAERVHRRHWNGVCGLGTWVETLTVTSTGLPLPAATPPGAGRAGARLDDAAHVLVGLGRQADHEVELHLAPARD